MENEVNISTTLTLYNNQAISLSDDVYSTIDNIDFVNFRNWDSLEIDKFTKVINVTIINTAHINTDYSKLKLFPEQKIGLTIKNCKENVIIDDLILSSLRVINCNNKTFGKNIMVDEVIIISDSQNIILNFAIDNSACCFKNSEITIKC